MSQVISGFGTKVRIVASTTFPQGFDVNSFDEEQDPIEIDNIEVSGTTQGLNGDLISWSTPNPINVSFSVIPDTDDDANLSILLEANRTGYNKQSAQDEISMSVYYPNNQIVTFTNGIIMSGDPATSINSSGRKKSKTYSFSFENRVSTV